ncbi:MAG: cell division protein FtsA [Deltaproteobacteria bacterium]|nr:cell division protein FtsA [Deltaproteobacteria bacterium]MBW1718618.1 cell division protein FtsA [Deltaproteobacteria bacterium]MBW1931614.1 cell division protein FtsA [Deltaproteobacteria bacterium]MBW1937461.1 cell division protein FtsA [Deltaproteobacteria bacterium]MBW2080176.1 cell division protein FtsA [Deltaproteobacteria bacterium]
MVEKPGNMIVGLDIGTTKICAVVGESNEKGSEIIGVGTYPSVGLRKGVVVNIDNTVDSIQRAIEEAELMAGCEIGSVFIGIAGSHIKGFNSHGVIAVKGQEVSQEDVDRVIDAARAVAIPLDREVIHILPQEYIVDEQGGILDPVGITGVRLEAKVHIVTGAVTAAQNLIKCANRAGLDVVDIVFQPLASAEAVLTQEEKDLGVALVDFGGGTTDLALFTESAIKHTAVLGLGGNNLTNDIAVGLRTPSKEAEQIKIRNGSCINSMVDKDQMIEVPGVGGRKPRLLSRHILSEILEPRVEEIFTLIDQEIERTELKELLASGIVITGGSALLSGIAEIADQVFQLPTRVGFPRRISGLVDVVNGPMFATAVGLVLYGMEHQSQKKFRIRDGNIFNRVTLRMKSWFKI